MSNKLRGQVYYGNIEDHKAEKSSWIMNLCLEGAFSDM